MVHRFPDFSDDSHFPNSQSLPVCVGCSFRLLLALVDSRVASKAARIAYPPAAAGTSDERSQIGQYVHTITTIYMIQGGLRQWRRAPPCETHKQRSLTLISCGVLATVPLNVLVYFFLIQAPFFGCPPHPESRGSDVSPRAGIIFFS